MIARISWLALIKLKWRFARRAIKLRKKSRINKTDIRKD